MDSDHQDHGDDPAELDLEAVLAEAVAIADGRIVFTGSDSGAAKLAGPSTKIIDLRGRMVLPGFHDSHTHLMEGGVGMSLCNLKDLKTPQEALAEIRKFATAHPERPWVTGAGWDLPVFPAANPRKEQFDEVVRDRPNPNKFRSRYWAPTMPPS